MTKELHELARAALNLPLEDRAVLVEELLSSLANDVSEDVEVVWQNEAQRRLSEMRHSSVVSVPWEEVRQTVKNKLNAKS